MKSKVGRIIFIVFIAGFLGGCNTCEKDAKQEVDAKAKLRSENVSFSSSAFMKAARKGNAKILKLFLEAGMDVNIIDNGTALTYAVYVDNIDSVKFLLDNGADVNQSAYWGTPLGIASYKDYYKIASMLIERGADVNEVSGNGLTPLLNAVLMTGRSRIVELLLDNGADPNFEQEQTKETALIIAAGKGYLKIVELLIKAGGDVNYLDSGKLSPLDWALLYDHMDVAEVLLKNKGVYDEDVSDVPMIVALKRKNFEFAELLLKNGISVNGSFGEMPLIVWSAKLKMNDSVEFLVEHGADLQAVDKDGCTALDYALQNKDSALVKYLKSAITMDKNKKSVLETEEAE